MTDQYYVSLTKGLMMGRLMSLQLLASCLLTVLYTQAPLAMDSQLLKQKLKLRTQMLEQAQAHSEGKQGLDENNSIEGFLGDLLKVSNVYKIDDQDLMNGTVAKEVWSANHWPYKKGLLANRHWKDGHTWGQYYQTYTQNPPMVAYQRGRSEELNLLSPAEKYDILVGDTNFGLTRANWQSGRELSDSQGDVQMWYGICNGTAAAAIMMPRPARAIEVLASDGRTHLTFYPSDLKGLGGLLWTGDTFTYQTLGALCSVRAPSADANNRVLASECFDINPAAWHLAMVNLIGLQQKAFTFDYAYDEEIWNSPMKSYNFKYYNVNNGKLTSMLHEGLIPIAAYTRDPFKRYRNPKATHILGIHTYIRYVGGMNLNRDEANSSRQDNVMVRELKYDLELDAAGNILGGEWYTKEHPDFIWRITSNEALTAQDRALRQQHGTLYWSQSQAAPAVLKTYAQQSSQQNNRPLATVVNQLFQWAK